MLDAMRKRANSWVVRALLLVLIASFAVWGIGDVFVGRQDIDVAATGADGNVVFLYLNDGDGMGWDVEQIEGAMASGQAAAPPPPPPAQPPISPEDRTQRPPIRTKSANR